MPRPGPDLRVRHGLPAAVKERELHLEDRWVTEVTSSRIQLILETDGDWRSQVTTTLTGVKHDQVTYDDVSTCDCKEYLLFQDREILECTLPSRIS